MAERRSHLILVACIVAALLGAAALIVPGSPIQRDPRLGLDLQGGLEVILRAVPPPGEQLQEADLDRSLDIMRNRVDKLGVAEPTVTKQGDDQISIQMPGIRNPEDAARLIGKTAKLELYDFEADLVRPSIDTQQFPVATPSLYELLASVQGRATEGNPERWYLFDERKKLVAGPKPTRESLLNSRAVGREGGEAGELPKGWKAFAIPEKTKVISCPAENGCLGARTAAPIYYYLIKHDPNAGIPEMTGDDLVLSGTRQDFDTGTSEPIVTMQFTDDGEDKFARITAEEARRGKIYTNLYGGGGEDVFQHFAIVLDNEIQSTPYIDFRQNPNGIAGGNGAQITGIGSLKEARDLALVLQTGALPVEFTTLEHTEISATLGEDSLDQAIRAALAGMLVVALFLLIAYRFLGLVAVLGLAIYAAFLYAAILLLNVTLTLPGFAGMILTIGVAADANIVIFERIKEESRSGKSVRAAIGAGYSKGFSTIIDANVVTAITALVLFAFATAGVKGFALLLLIGTAISLVTAVAATRAMLGLLAGFRWFNSPRFMGAQGQQTARWLQIDYIGLRRYWFGFSAVVLAVCIGAIGLKGLNLGIDFEGGSEISFRTPQPVALADVRTTAQTVGEGGAQIQGVGRETNGRYTEFQILAKELDTAERRELQRSLEDEVQATAFGATSVSASFGRQIAESALYAIAFSLFLVVLYITIRFQWKFGAAVIAALLHDVLIAVGIYAFTGREVTTATVAAVLTVLGYSIYDTIIILDRVRENMPLMRRAPFAQIGNQSLWETIRRSLATTFITLLPITALYFFGGETLKDFAFALLVGIGSGAYSSIFIAAPLVAVFKEREPEYARRKAGLEPGVAGDGDGERPVA
ncbi:MAG: protein translocase subunit SecD, partial [Actinomycetota bacterium]|nr:protein translocase subunit SecD [Actinomycetota bacterium]